MRTGFAIHFRLVIGMLSTALGVCPMYMRSQKGELEGMPAVMVDDSGCTGTEEFLQAEMALRCHDKIGKRQFLTEANPLRLGGVHVQHKGVSTLEVNQTECIYSALQEKKMRLTLSQPSPR